MNFDKLRKEEYDHGYKVGYVKGYEDAKKEFEKPCGEWIIDGHHIRCNRCNEYMCNTDREGDKIPDNFYGNCGALMKGYADMKGGAE